MRIDTFIRFFITVVVFLVAVALAALLWRYYMLSPWTRDGRVRADVVTIAPDVSGIVARVAVEDNQRVKRGDILFILDQERYKLALAEAEARYVSQELETRRLVDEAARRAKVGNDVVSYEARQQAQSAAKSAQANLLEAAAARDRARLDLERTVVRSPVDGYVTNLSVFAGDYASAGVATLAVIDENSFWICGYFEETKLSRIRVGDKALVEMIDGSEPLHGVVEGIAKGISESENATGQRLLLDVNPTYNWVRLAQRIPVRIRLEGRVSDRISVGMSCTVSIEE